MITFPEAVTFFCRYQEVVGFFCLFVFALIESSLILIIIYRTSNLSSPPVKTLLSPCLCHSVGFLFRDVLLRPALEKVIEKKTPQEKNYINDSMMHGTLE